MTQKLLTRETAQSQCHGISIKNTIVTSWKNARTQVVLKIFFYALQMGLSTYIRNSRFKAIPTLEF